MLAWHQWVLTLESQCKRQWRSFTRESIGGWRKYEVQWMFSACTGWRQEWHPTSKTLHQIPSHKITYLPSIPLPVPFYCLRTWQDGVKEDVKCFGLSRCPESIGYTGPEQMEMKSQGDNRLNKVHLEEWLNEWLNVWMYVCMYVCVCTSLSSSSFLACTTKNTTTRNRQVSEWTYGKLAEMSGLELYIGYMTLTVYKYHASSAYHASCLYTEYGNPCLSICLKLLH